MSKEMKAQTEKMDQELLKEKERVVSDIVTATTKKTKGTKPAKKINKYNKSSKSLDEETPLSEYMESVQVKRKANKTKLQSLGLIPKSPPPTRSLKTSEPRKKQEPPKKRIRISRRLYEDKDLVKICTCDHKDVSCFKEETDKRFFHEDGDLFDTSCATCGVSFASITCTSNEAVYIPASNNQDFFCTGRWKFDCTHGYCRPCYLELLNLDSNSRSWRKKVFVCLT